MTTGSEYERFSRLEARGVSDLYEEWAASIAADVELIRLIDGLPRSKRQPNLVFAAARAAGAPLERYSSVRAWLLQHWDAVQAVVARRSTQTNEPARCVAAVAALRDVAGPVALLEVGASAGLCLYPDRLHYRFRTEGGLRQLGPESGVEVECDWSGEAPPPTTLPEVVWRAGVDLNPLDVFDAEDARWLEYLIWPEQEERRTRLLAAMELVRQDPPLLHRGDAVDEVVATSATAPADATLVVLHSAVLTYLSEQARRGFVESVRRLGATWISVEGARVLPDVARALPAGTTADRDFIVARDGTPVGLLGPHGQRYRALATL